MVPKKATAPQEDRKTPIREPYVMAWCVGSISFNWYPTDGALYANDLQGNGHFISTARNEEVARAMAKGFAVGRGSVAR